MRFGERKRGFVPVTKNELVGRLREVAFEHGEQISIKKFCRLTRIPENQVYLHFDSWGDAREEAGLERRTKPRPFYSEEDVLKAYHGVVQELGRFPSGSEFARHSGMGAHRIFVRFGSMRELLVRYRKWLVHKQRQESEQPLERVTNPTQLCPAENPDRDVRWLRRKWYSLRVGFELRSSHFRGRPADICDLLVCLDHDWPACPVKVLQLSDVLGQAARASDANRSPV